MKINKRLITSSILATAILGAGVVKVSHDSNEYINVAKENNMARGSDKWAAEGNTGRTRYMLEDVPAETKGVNSNWWEYKSTSFYSQGSSVTDTNDAYIGLNFQLTTVPEGETKVINGIETSQYYKIGVVFYSGKQSDGTYTAPKLQAALNFLMTRTPGQDGGIDTIESYGKQFSLVHRDWDKAPTNTQYLADGVTPNPAYTGHEPTAGDQYYMSTDSYELNVPEETWHEYFDNDATTLFGDETYNPLNHMIVEFPIVDTNMYDGITTDWGGVINDYDNGADTFYSESGGYNQICLKAISKDDAVALDSYQISNSTATGAYSTEIYKMRFSSAYDKTLGDYEANNDNIMLLSYPTPEFTVTPLGYNDKNQYEVGVKYDHTSVPTTYDIVDSISYTLEGPKSTDDSSQVVWDTITIDDNGVTRQSRTSYDDPTLSDPITWTFGEEGNPEWVEEWNDGYNGTGDGTENYGGEVTADGTVEGFDSLTGFTGDMEVGESAPINQTITYDNLFYGTSEDDSSRQYTFSSQINLAPTTLGTENAYLNGIAPGALTTIEGEEVSLTLNPGAAVPIINNFDVIRPSDTTSIGTSDDIEFNVAGDTKVEAENMSETGTRPTYLQSAQVFAQEEIPATEEGGEVTYGTAFAITDVTAITEEQIDQVDGTFDITLTSTSESRATAFNPNTNYRFYLEMTYGDDPSVTTDGPITKDFNSDEYFINVTTGKLGSLDITLSNVVVTKDGTGGLNITFDYSQSIPSGGAGVIEDWDTQVISSVSVYDDDATFDATGNLVTGTKITDVDITGLDSTVYGSKTINVPSDALVANSTYQPYVVVTTEHGDTFHGQATTPVVTDALGAFKPIIRNITHTDTDVEGGVSTVFTFDVEQQVGDKVDESEYTASVVSDITFNLYEGDSVATGTQVETVAFTPSTEDGTTSFTSEGTSLDTFVFNTTSSYAYEILVSYADGVSNVEGTLNFELNGNSNMDVATDLVATSASSTMTSLSFGFDVNDTTFVPGLDSYSIKSAELVDQNGSAVEDVEFTWKDADGNEVENVQDILRTEGTLYSASASVVVKNIAPGTDITKWSIEFTTDSHIIEPDDTLPTAETEYSISLLDLFLNEGDTTAPVITGSEGEGYTLTGSDDGTKEVMDIESMEVIGISETQVINQTDATFEITMNDPSGIYSNVSDLQVLANGETFSVANGNLEVKDITATKAGEITLRIKLMDLKAGTSYTVTGLSYLVSETGSSARQSATMSEFSFSTLSAPKDDKHFPWWIIILLLIITAGIALFLIWLLLLRKKDEDQEEEDAKGNGTSKKLDTTTTKETKAKATNGKPTAAELNKMTKPQLMELATQEYEADSLKGYTKADLVELLSN